MAKIDKIKNKKMHTYTSLGKAEINELTNARILGTCFIDLKGLKTLSVRNDFNEELA